MTQETTNPTFETSNPQFVTHSNLPKSTFAYVTSAASTIVEVKAEYETLSNDLKLRAISSLNDWMHTEIAKLLNQNKQPMENQPIQNQSTETYVNPLTAPSNYDLATLLNELKFGRPANDQLLLQKWIDELCEPKQITYETIYRRTSKKSY
jgi:hypothetical protein